MPEEFGTVNLKQGAQTREIDLLRRHYRTHRDALSRLIPEAPSQHLAAEYQRLVNDIDLAVRKLDELEADTNPMMKKSAPGTRPLVRPQEAPAGTPPALSSSRVRVISIVLSGLVVLLLIGWLIFRASSEPKVLPVNTTTAPPPAVTPAPAPVAALRVTPALADYGTIRKGTRAVRQFEVTNVSDGVVEIEVGRSACRCLYYDYNGKLPARGKETVTVTVDGARAKAGPLKEQVEVHAKNDPAVTATFAVQAMIK
jgi:hypothetical protein